MFAVIPELECDGSILPELKRKFLYNNISADVNYVICISFNRNVPAGSWMRKLSRLFTHSSSLKEVQYVNECKLVFFLVELCSFIFNSVTSACVG